MIQCISVNLRGCDFQGGILLFGGGGVIILGCTYFIG